MSSVISQINYQVLEKKVAEKPVLFALETKSKLMALVKIIDKWEFYVSVFD